MLTHHEATTLQKKKIIPDDTCGICKEEKKDVFHAIFKCQSLWLHWKNIFPSLKVHTGPATFLSMTMAIFEQLDSPGPDTMLVVSWSLWHQQNKWVYDKERIHLSLTIKLALALLQSFSTLRGQFHTIKQITGK